MNRPIGARSRRCSRRSASRDAATDRRVAQIVADVRRKGDRALLRYARESRRPDGPDRDLADEMQTAAATVPQSVRAGDPRRGAQHPRGREASGAARVACRASRAGVTVEQRVIPLDRVGCYVPGGRYPLPSSLLMTAIPAVAAGVARRRRGVPAAGAGRHGGGARSRRLAALPDRRRARDCRAGLRHRDRCRAWTRSSGPAIAGWRRPRRSSPPTAASTSTPARREILIVVDHGPGRLDRCRSDRTGRARSRCARGAHHAQPRARRRVAREVDGPNARRRPGRASLAAHGGIIVTRVAGRSDRARQRRRARTPGRRR